MFITDIYECKHRDETGRVNLSLKFTTRLAKQAW